MTPVKLKEGGGSAKVHISAATAKILEEEKIASVDPLGGGVYRLKGRLKVGAVCFPDLELHIEPKLTISRLWFLLGFAHDRLGWQEQEVVADEHADLLPGVAYAFLRAMGKALPYGLPHGYRQESRALPVVRGRIRQADQWRRHHGRLLPVEATYYSFTVDTPEARILRAATERLLTLPGVHPTAQDRLRDLLTRLRGVSPLPAGTAPAWRPSPANIRYRTALGLAELVLRGGSFEFHGGPGRPPLAVDGLLVGMDKVFEDFLEHALGGLLTPHGGACEAQDKVYLDTRDRLEMKPDIHWYEGERTLAIIDAKYSQKKPSSEHRHQMVAYCARFDSRQGHIVYAGGKQEPTRRHRIIRPQMDLFQHTLDLSAPIGDVRVQVEKIAEQIIALAAVARGRRKTIRIRRRTVP